ncbi:MAG: hypothetical protein VKP62_16585 [Candidatus Sericytochromatia bacterium]|nr:hypothetical protein [Candidatus Sericytochromatia bacterium]
MRPDPRHDTIDTHVTLHDRSQFEVQFTYGVAAEHLVRGQANEHFRVEAFCFFPSNLGITELNYPREAFYRNLHAYFRFKTPVMSEEELLDPLNRNSPINMLSFLLKRLAMGEALDEVVAPAEARLFGTVVSQLMRTRQAQAEALMTRAKQHGEVAVWREFEGCCATLVRSIPQLLAKYRQLLADYQTFQGRVPDALLQALQHVDEFLTYRFDHTLAAMHFILTSAWEAPVKLDRVGDLLHAAADEEAGYRRRQGYLQLSPGDEQALALYTYRSGALKKLIDQVLYLDVRTKQQTNRWRNLAAGAGAMVAALFAGYTDRSVTLPLYQHGLWLAVTVFAAFYVAKDRLKEVLREYVWDKVSQYFPDNRLTVVDPANGLRIGHCNEKVRHLPKGKVPADVLAIRNAAHVVDLDSARKESVMLYRNDVTLRAREILQEHQRRTHVKHILRFGIEELLPRLDNPTSRVQFYDNDSHVFCRLRAPKVYHLNVVFRLTPRDEGHGTGGPVYRRIRVILDKNGIHRIDDVSLSEDTSLTRSVEKQSSPRVREEDPMY